MKAAVAAVVVLLLTAGSAGTWFVNHAELSPRLLANYVERRAEGHNRLIEGAGRLAAWVMRRADRGDSDALTAYPAWAGATREWAPESTGKAVEGRVVFVSTPDDLRTALDSALPGDRITLLPGTYRLSKTPIVLVRSGTNTQPIVVRASRLGEVVIESSLLEGFHVTAPFWTFENLVIRGVCPHDEDCEHAFHVTGDGRGFTARNLIVRDFNAQFKVNGSNGVFPDGGVIEHSTLAASHERKTDGPVTAIDIVAANDWRVEGNLIADFIKAGGNTTSYGAFAKGGASSTRFLRNVVLCEHLLRSRGGRRIGLSRWRRYLCRGLSRSKVHRRAWRRDN